MPNSTSNPATPSNAYQSETVGAPDPPWFDLILAAETRRMPAASKIVKITYAAMETTATTAKAAQSICIRLRSSLWAA